MQQIQPATKSQCLSFDEADLEIRAKLVDGAAVIRVMKSGACIHSVRIDDAVGPLEHSWIADLFAREERVSVSRLTREVDDYVGGLNINQG